MDKLQPITTDQMERLSVDSRNNLYWDRKPIVTEQRVKLQTAVSWSVISAAAATVISAIIQLIHLFG